MSYCRISDIKVQSEDGGTCYEKNTILIFITFISFKLYTASKVKHRLNIFLEKNIEAFQT